MATAPATQLHPLLARWALGTDAGRTGGAAAVTAPLDPGLISPRSLADDPLPYYSSAQLDSAVLEPRQPAAAMWSATYVQPSSRAAHGARETGSSGSSDVHEMLSGDEEDETTPDSAAIENQLPSHKVISLASFACENRLRQNQPRRKRSQRAPQFKREHRSVKVGSLHRLRVNGRSATRRNRTPRRWHSWRRCWL